jgi:2,3-bisphosphoglycerate-dependent phosphoglycerate mutase
MSQGTVKISLVRHAESAWNQERRLQGWQDISLSDRGRQQAVELRERLRGQSYDQIWSSDLQRAVETARLVVGEPSQDARLRELHMGTLEGKLWYELDTSVMNAMSDWKTFSAPEGESYGQLWDRVTAFLNELTTGHHIIFSHGGVIRTLLRGHGVEARVPNCTQVVFDWTQRRLMAVVEPGLSNNDLD